MNSDLIKIVIEDQKEEIESKFKNENIITREGLKESKKYIAAPFAFITMGLRRCGKSIFSHLMVREKKYGYVNFDDERLRACTVGDLNKVLEVIYQLYGNIDYIILDEIQNILGWELFVTRLQRTKRVIITGSNSNLLNTELSTHLTGRYMDLILYPFSFREFLKFNDFVPNPYLTTSIGQTKKYLEDYLQKGGIPDCYTFGVRYLLNLYSNILEKDVLSRYRIKYQKEFHEMARCLISNHSKEFSYNKLAKIWKIKNVHTVINYLNYLENSFIVFELLRFSYKLKEQHLAPKKIYCIDPGIINIVGFQTSENKGQLMENIVAIELQRAKAFDPQLEIYYWKDHQQREVDFIVKKKKAVLKCIQVTYASELYDLENREMKSLSRAGKELGCKNLIIITWDYESENEGIHYIPLWKWLLYENPTNAAID